MLKKQQIISNREFFYVFKFGYFTLIFYVMLLKIAKIEMPKETGDADIAYDTGFASQSHLCTVFKKFMGIIVDDYRNILRKK